MAKGVLIFLPEEEGKNFGFQEGARGEGVKKMGQRHKNKHFCAKGGVVQILRSF